ncbi:MAG: hypothetical protein A2219_05965 [Elusimicrobia bacterium RIFOXYA2_FULL_50_26]|nr:MAG: hypothetical protein A2219_05965 [Elusimicrobia bacterium RIFOXYA2_FULL_50_26]OGS24844.1 MAG: hypothetical protein A2314_02185 [Elusimicrobia bacterium RIFOXYB2_FULL_50_12]
MDTLLLHHCCLPCSPKALELLGAEYKITGFWYNPNIHPEDEWQRRRTSLASYLASLNIQLCDGAQADGQDWIKRASDAPDRCAFCYRLRLEETARMASELGISHFSTTLLSSPWQKHELIRRAGEAASQKHKVDFVYRDFRGVYYEGKNIAWRFGSYMQKYCGCTFSMGDLP